MADPDEERRARVAALIAVGWMLRRGIVYPETHYLIGSDARWYRIDDNFQMEEAWTVYLRQQPG